MSDHDRVVSSWHTRFRNGTDHDLWGQPVEAIREYQKLSKELFEETGTSNKMFSDEQKKIIRKISVCLDLRSKSLQKPGSSDGISLDDLKKIERTLKNVTSQSSRDFPVDVGAAQLKNQTYVQMQYITEGESVEDKQNIRIGLYGMFSIFDRDNLLPRPIAVKGRPVLTVTVEKIGFKDASQFIDPFITMSVKDDHCIDLTASQDTPIAIRKEDSHVVFDVDIHIQKTLDSLPPGYAIFFEFCHYKPKKKVISTKCWTFLEQEEIKEGPVVLELYRKPTDFKRKSIRLLSIKPLYLHLKLTIHQ